MIDRRASDPFQEGHMSRSDRVKQGIEGLNARNFVAAARTSPTTSSSTRWGLGLEVEGVTR